MNILLLELVVVIDRAFFRFNMQNNCVMHWGGGKVRDKVTRSDGFLPYLIRQTRFVHAMTIAVGDVVRTIID